MPLDLLNWIDTELPPQATRAQLAAKANLGLRTIDRALARGELAALRIGRKVLIPRAAARAWLSTMVEAR